MLFWNFVVFGFLVFINFLLLFLVTLALTFHPWNSEFIEPGETLLFLGAGKIKYLWYEGTGTWLFTVCGILNTTSLY